MPTKSQWQLRIPEIIRTLETLNVPVVDRAICERLFAVRRRRAITLIQGFGGYRVGNSVLVDRPALLRQLHKLHSDPAVEYERNRKAKLSDELDRLQMERKAVNIIIEGAREAKYMSVKWPPSGVQLSEGCLVIKFADAQELLLRLYELSQAAAADFDHFRRLAGPVTLQVSPATSAP